MKKRIGILLFAAALFGATSASAASDGPTCIWVGGLWMCDY